MSDTGRKDISSSVSETLTPDSSKSTTDKVSENVSGMADKVGSSLQPEGDKSATQKMSDSTSSSAGDEGKSYMQSAQEGISNAASSVQETLGGGKSS